MWAELGKIIISAGAVYVIAVLSEKLAKKSAALEEAERRAYENEKVETIINANADLGRGDLLNCLRGSAGKK